MSSPQFDYVVVGGGTAGCLLANRLSADPNKRVLLVEAGGRDNYHWIHIPVGYLYCIGNPRTDWLFKTEPDAGLNGRVLRYPRGKVMGGSSSINGMIYMRGQAQDYEDWARLTGDDAWTWANCLPNFKRHEDHWRLDAEHAANHAFAALHGNKTQGGGGEWRVEKPRVRWDILDAFALAANQAGIPATQDFNGGDNNGVAYFEVNQKSGWRWNASKAFLGKDVLRRPNLTLWTGMQATRLLFDDTSSGALRCGGVQLWDGRQMVEARAEKELLLCTGAVGSPQLLQLSGIGPAALLQRHGIAVRLDAPGVGANLQDHLQIRAMFKVQDVATLNTIAASLLGKAKIALEYALTRSGPMSMAPSQLGLFTRSSPDQERVNLQYHVQPLSLDAFGEPLHSFPAFTASVCNLAPTSRGSVQITSADFKAAPAIAPNYLSTELDRKVAADSLRVTRHIVAQAPLARFKPVEYKPGAQYQGDEELARLAGDIATTIFHPVGTTKMGRSDDPMAVLDSHLRLRDGSGAEGGVVHGLRVVDAGAMPQIIRGNTNSPTLMIAEKAAAWILEGK